MESCCNLNISDIYTYLYNFIIEIAKMQLDVDIEPTLRFPGMTRIGKQMDQSESKA